MPVIPSDSKIIKFGFLGTCLLAVPLCLFGCGDSGETESTTSNDSATSPEMSKTKPAASANLSVADKEKLAIPEQSGALDVAPPMRKADENRINPVGLGDSPIRFEPDPLDLGEMTADVAKTGSVTLVNTTDQPVTITKAIPGCGCTTLGWPKDPIPAGGSADIDITLKPGAKQGVKLRKRVTFQIEGFQSQILQVVGDVAEYVSIKPAIVPARVDDAKMSEAIVLTSLDDTPFKITGVRPDAVGMYSSEAAKEHSIQIDWDAWEAESRPVKITFLLDHPLSVQVSTLVKRRATKRAPSAPGVTDASGTTPGINDLSGAARAGDAARVRLLIAEGTNLDQADTNGRRTPLHWGVLGNHMEVVQVLLEGGANPNVGDQAGKTPLEHAAEKSMVEMTALLLKSGADVNQRDLVGGNAVLWAAGLGSPETLKLVVDAGGEIEVKDINGLSPLTWAAQTGNPASMRILIEAGADVNSVDSLAGESVLMRAARSGKLESVEMLFESGVDTSTLTRVDANALHIAAEFSNAAIVQRLMDSGLDPNVTDMRKRNALDYAKNRVDDSRFAVIELLETKVSKPAESE
jgi:ankyrin repeat protein